MTDLEKCPVCGSSLKIHIAGFRKFYCGLMETKNPLMDKWDNHHPCRFAHEIAIEKGEIIDIQIKQLLKKDQEIQEQFEEIQRLEEEIEELKVWRQYDQNALAVYRKGAEIDRKKIERLKEELKVFYDRDGYIWKDSPEPEEEK